MHRFLLGIQQFQRNIFPDRRQQFERLAEGQQPPALFITCSDSRIVPHLVTQTDPGELFVHRNAGNLVPPYESANSGEAATIEYAVQVLKVAEIIVCGHSHCGAMNALINPSSTNELPAIREWLKHAEATQRFLGANGDSRYPNDDRLTAAVKTNVAVQLDHLRTYPSVAGACIDGSLTLYGWFYRFETGEVAVLNEATGEFESAPAQVKEVSTVG